MKLITETSDSIVAESVNKSLYVSGIFSSANVRNKNGRVYEKNLLNREVDKLMEQVSSKSLFGELNHPKTPEINLEKVAILVEELRWHNDDLIGKAKVLDKTYCGGILKGIIESGGNVGISSRGLGTVSEDGSVNDDFSLICWDIVADASNPGSKFVNGIYEGKEFGSTNDVSLNEAKNKAFQHIWQVLEKIEKQI